MPYAEYTPPLVDPPAGSDVIEDWKLFYGIAAHMGLQLNLQPYFPQPGQTPRQLDMKNAPELDDLMTWLFTNSRVPWSSVKEAVGGKVYDDEDVYVLPADQGSSGRLDVANPEMLDELRTSDRAWWPDDPEYPFRLLCRRHIGALNSSGRDLPRMAERPFNPAYLHPEDLAALGVPEGASVEIRSRTGVVEAVVEADPNLRRGLVSMTHGYGDVAIPADSPTTAPFHTAGANLNALLRVDDDYDRITGMPHMSNVAVAITAIS